MKRANLHLSTDAASAPSSCYLLCALFCAIERVSARARTPFVGTHWRGYYSSWRRNPTRRKAVSGPVVGYCLALLLYTLAWVLPHSPSLLIKAILCAAGVFVGGSRPTNRIWTCAGSKGLDPRNMRHTFESIPPHRCLQQQRRRSQTARNATALLPFGSQDYCARRLVSVFLVLIDPDGHRVAHSPATTGAVPPTTENHVRAPNNMIRSSFPRAYSGVRLPGTRRTTRRARTDGTRGLQSSSGDDGDKEEFWEWNVDNSGTDAAADTNSWDDSSQDKYERLGGGRGAKTGGSVFLFYEHQRRFVWVCFSTLCALTGSKRNDALQGTPIAQSVDYAAYHAPRST